MIEFAPTPEEQAFIDRQVTEGRFKSAAEVVLAALGSAMRYDEAHDKERSIVIAINAGASGRHRIWVDARPPSKKEIVASIRAHEADLRARGVRRLALFGSVARGEASADSDIDILVVIDRAGSFSAYDFVGIQLYLERVLRRSVQLVDRERLREDIRPSAEREAIDIF